MTYAKYAYGGNLMPDQAPQTLDEILLNLEKGFVQLQGDRFDGFFDGAINKPEAKAAITTLMERVIGEDLDQVPEKYHEEHFVIQAVNHHKSEQRKRLANLIDKESER
jgi:hypothetical protein